MKKLVTPSAKISVKETEFILKNLKQAYKNSETENSKQVITRLVKTTLYIASETRRSNFVSEAALDIWNGMFPNEDLYNLTVPVQRGYKKRYPRLKEIVLEHCIPLSELATQILEQNAEIKELLENDLITAWISKTEDNRLNEKNKVSRPQGWRSVYSKLNITLADLT